MVLKNLESNERWAVERWAVERIRELWWQKIIIDGDKNMFRKKRLDASITCEEDDTWVVKLYRNEPVDNWFETVCEQYPDRPSYILKIKDGEIVSAEFLVCLDPYGIGAEVWYEELKNPEQDWLFLAIADTIRAMEKIIGRFKESSSISKAHKEKWFRKEYGIKWMIQEGEWE